MAAYNKTTWTSDVPASTPVKFSITGDIEGPISASAEIAMVTPGTPGVAVSPGNLNHMEYGIESAQNAADAAQADANTAQASAVVAQAAADLVQDNLDDTNDLIDLMRIHVTITLSSQSIPDSTLTKVLFDTVSGSDPDGFFDAANNQIKIPPTGFYGFYDIVVGANWSSHATGGTKRQIDIQINGASQAALTLPAISGESCWIYIHYGVILTAGYTIQLRAQQKSGGALNLNAISLTILGKS